MRALYNLSKQKHAKHAAIAAAIALFVMLAALKLAAAALLIAASVAVSVAVHFLRIRSIGVELVTFATVLISIAYGSTAGAIVGVSLILIHLFLGQFLGEYVVWTVGSYVVVALLAPTFGGGIASAGFVLNAIRNGINVACMLVFSRQYLGRYVPFTITNILFNWALFTFAGQPVMALFK